MLAGRRLTRFVIPPNALVLWSFGALVVKGDLNDEADAALKGAYGASLGTKF